MLDGFLLGGETFKKSVPKASEQAGLVQEPRHECFSVPVDHVTTHPVCGIHRGNKADMLMKESILSLVTDYLV